MRIALVVSFDVSDGFFCVDIYEFVYCVFVWIGNFLFIDRKMWSKLMMWEIRLI